MRATIYWIEGISPYRLAIFPRPRGGDWLSDELASLKQGGVDLLLSLLTSPETRELELSEEGSLSQAQGISFFSLPIPDRALPASFQEVFSLTETLSIKLKEGRGLGIHCRMGIGRASLMAVCILGRLGRDPQETFPLIEKARGRPVPDVPEQRTWAEDFVRWQREKNP